MFKLCCVVGARPNFMKIAPIMRCLRAHLDRFEPYLVHTGQHYDKAMKESFFMQLDIPEPDIDLEVGSGSHAIQTAEIMKRFEPVLDEVKPQAILVVGDVNSTIACALVAAKKNVKVIHVEAGLRSYDREMPEELNRVLTDQISDLLFTTEKHAEQNLVREGIAREKVHFVGNVMIDTLFFNLEKTKSSEEISKAHSLNIGDGNATYGIVTLHRPSNVDDRSTLRSLLETLAQISETLPLIFPVHPRTATKIRDAELLDIVKNSLIRLVDPLGYLELLGLMKTARLVLTDSGGIQEETTALGIPCLTLRNNTERPVTVTDGTNTVVGTDRQKIIQTFEDIMATGGKAGRVPELWDGHAAERIIDVLTDWSSSCPT